MRKPVWTPDLREQLKRERADYRGRGSAASIARKLGISYSSVCDEILRLEGAPKGDRHGPQRDSRQRCQCGSPVFNDETTAFRFCSACRAGMGQRVVPTWAEAL